MVPNDLLKEVSGLAGKGSELHRRHGVYLDPVTIVAAPESYEDRLMPLFPDSWSRIEIFALEAHDLALAKLERNSDRDRDDIHRMARAGYLKPHILRERYEKELRPYLLARPEWHDTTLKLWIDSYWPDYVL